VLPVTWSRPSVGRLRIPTAVNVYKPLTSTTVGVAVPGGLTAWGSNDWADMSPWPQNSYHQPRHVAFIGGGIRIFQDDTTINKDPSVSVTTEQLTPQQRFDLFRPEFLAIDIETGTNLLTYYWPIIQNQTAFQNLTSTANTNAFYKLFPVLQSGSNFIPYSMSDPLALDVRNSDSNIVEDDGYVDTVYVGDLLGNFYGLKFNFDTQVISHTTGNPVANPNFGIRVDWWQTKSTWDGSPATNSNMDYFRGLRQPITVPPVASFDGADTNFLHVIFGAGKFEDIPDSLNDDMADISRTSIYNLKDLVETPKDNFFSANAQTLGNFKIEVNPRCPQANASCGSAHTIRDWPKSPDTPCVWIKDDLVTRDCGEANCPQPLNPSSPCVDPCWNCIYDLMGPITSGQTIPSATDLTEPGERVVRKALIAGGLVFITTTTPPSSQCVSQGTSNLYVLSYDCGVIPGGKNIFLDASVSAIGLKTGSTNTYDPRGWVVNLGTGVASNPVLDSSGTHVIIQMSSGDIKNFNVQLPMKIMQPLGWRER